MQGPGLYSAVYFRTDYEGGVNERTLRVEGASDAVIGAESGSKTQMAYTAGSSAAADPTGLALNL